MKLPRRIKIDGRNWKITRGDPGDGDRGSCDHDTRTIIIDPDLEGRELEETFWHEVLHAAMPEATFIVSIKKEEALVELLCRRLPGVIKQVWRVGSK